MNRWTARSIELANKRDYLDRLHEVYPMIQNQPRSIDPATWEKAARALDTGNDSTLLVALLDMKLFPIKHPFVAYMKKDRESIRRNPVTVRRIAAELRGYGKEQIRRMCSAPKEKNRQIGPMFRTWLERTALGGGRGPAPQ